ncbi:MAG: hypothetical protein LBI34_03285 [Puniceicoccales bacterium]|nr:hypothetical protein [Puniceicoccales bacterium]
MNAIPLFDFIANRDALAFFEKEIDNIGSGAYRFITSSDGRIFVLKTCANYLGITLACVQENFPTAHKTFNVLAVYCMEFSKCADSAGKMSELCNMRMALIEAACNIREAINVKLMVA